MLEAFVITLREGVEAALVVCLLLAYLNKTGRPALKKPVLLGFAAAVAASLGIAAVLKLKGIDPQNEKVEGVLFLVSAFFVLSMAIWMHLHGRKLKREIEEKVEAIAAKPTGAQAFGLFLFTFLMVGREGVETVLFLAASTLSTEAVMTLVGGLAGIAVAVFLGIAFLKGSLRIDLRKFFAVTTIMLVIFAVQLLAGAFHEFVEAGVIKFSDPALYMAYVGPLVRHSTIFVIAVILLPFALVAWHALTAPAPATAAANPAEERKQRAMTASERGWRLGFATLAIVAIVALGGRHVYASRSLELSPTMMLEPREGVVRVSLASLKQGELGRYGVTSVDRVVRFIVYRTKDGAKVAFDACLLCADKGYVGGETHVQCLNCLAEINIDTLESGGGCNPLPLPREITASEVVVRVSDLEAKREFFATLPEAECPGCKMKFKVGRPGQRTCGMKECEGK